MCNGEHLTISGLVSIIVPVFNGEPYLRESLDSIFAQTFSPTEVIVMDDASTDGTSNIVSYYGDRLKYYRQSQNRGIYGNVNDGIALAKGEYIAVYHADDIYFPTMIEREVAFLERYPEAGAVFSSDIFIDVDGHEVGRLELPPEVSGETPHDYRTIFNALLKYKNRFLRCPSSMVRASVYLEVGPYRDHEFLNNSDLDMWLRITQKHVIGILEEHLFYYRYGHNSSAQRYHHLRKDQERYFQIMDLYLAEGDWKLATAEALAAYEAHRAEDQIMRVISHYILGNGEDAQKILNQVRVDQLLKSRSVQRGRLFVLFLALKGLLRIPRISLLANLFYRRWHLKGN